jgi:Rieske Fe-S protein
MLDQAAPLLASHTSRRSFLVRIIQGVHATMGLTLAFIFGRAVIAPSFERRSQTWLSAGDARMLADREPATVTLRVSRPDGATEFIDRRVVYLIKTGDQVKALDSTCTHLGCRTRFNPETRQIECPCHGGVYDLDGRVVAGPPPAPLNTLVTKIEAGRVMVQV